MQTYMCIYVGSYFKTKICTYSYRCIYICTNMYMFDNTYST